MRWTLALIALICLIGGAASQTMFTGEGYSASQLSFYNGPEVTSFDPFVQNYWNSYIQNSAALNPAINNQSNEMSLWLNSFPLSFDKQIQLQNSSFSANVPVDTNVSGTELTSSALKRDVSFNFNQDMGWQYTNTNTNSDQSAGSGSAPPKDSQGQIISQGITALFG
jgi:hypothetical protein